MTPFLAEARAQFHAQCMARLVRVRADGVPNFADGSSPVSSSIAKGVLTQLPGDPIAGKLPGQSTGKEFEVLVLEFVQATFSRMTHLRPGRWRMLRSSSIDRYEQYAHLAAIDEARRRDRALMAAIAPDYQIKPNIVVLRETEGDDVLNSAGLLVDASTATYASLRQREGGLPLLHASISCKYTIRSDRVQNTRAEALSLIRNRKGRAPHMVAVTAEPLPSRLGSIALGTGDVDCVYHFALPELVDAVASLDYADALELLQHMIDGKRLRDISDLPLDLAT